MTPSATRPRWSGLGVDFGDIADYVAHNDLGTASCCARSPRAVRGPARARLEHGRLRRGPLPLCRARARSPGAADGRGPRRRPLRAAVPGLRSPARARSGPRGRAARPAQRLRRDEGRPGAPLRGVRPRDGRHRHRAALPQRLRAADAARHALRRRRQLLPLRARRGQGAAGVRGRRPAARLRARARCRRRQRARARGRRPGRVQRRLRHAAHGGGHGAALARAVDPSLDPGHRPVARGRRPPRLRLARARRAELGFGAREDFEAGMREFARAKLRA